MLAGALTALGLAALAGATVEVAEGTCTSSRAVALALGDYVEAAPMTVSVAPTEDGVEVRISAPAVAPMVRRLTLTPADCGVLPRMLALMAERYARALPRRSWARRAPPVAPPTPSHLSLSKTPADRHPSYALALTADAGGTLGLDGAGPGLQAGASLELLSGRLGLLAGLGARVVPRVALGAGGALRVTAPWIEVGGLARGPLGPFEAHARLGVAVGAAIGEARGFEGASTDVGALVEPSLRVGLQLPRGLVFAVEGRLRAVGARFTGSDAGFAYESPLVRVGVLLGIRRALAFF